MSYKVVIPARYQSSRLPGKPLLDIHGRPMIEHVYRQVLQTAADAVIIATDHPQIADVCRAFGADVCMTAETHQSGTERLAEVAALRHFEADDIIVNVQGDEPMIPPEIIEQVAQNLQQNPSAQVATLATPIDSFESLQDPNIVKVLWDHQQFALYFSRAPIPWARDEFPQQQLGQGQPYYRHIGLYAYRSGFLKTYVTLPETVVERTEKLEQLRILWHGYHIHVDQACAIPPIGIDTAEDLHRIRHNVSV